MYDIVIKNNESDDTKTTMEIQSDKSYSNRTFHGYRIYDGCRFVAKTNMCIGKLNTFFEEHS